MHNLKYLFHGDKLLSVSVVEVTELTATLFSQEVLEMLEA